jgi:outer membrane receptor protein involved in Fe transport
MTTETGPMSCLRRVLATRIQAGAAPLVVTAVAAILVLAGPARAQTATVSVSGTVIDESGAVVPGATVQITGPGRRTSAISGPRGDYSFKNIGEGTYQITVTLAGFSQATRDNVSVGRSNVEVPPITIGLAKLGETVVVSASKAEDTLLTAPATMSLVTSDTIKSSAAANYGDLLRAVPGVNVVQLSARDVNLTSRQATSTLTNSQLVLLDGRTIYQDFFGFVLWDFVPNNMADIKQIEVIRGPASCIWGANALTGVVNIITKSPREAPGTTVTFNGGFFSRDAGSSVGRGAGGMFGANATVAEVANAQWSYRVSAGYFNSDPYPRPAGQIPPIVDPRVQPPDPTITVGGARYPADRSGPIGTAYQNRGTSQPKFDARVDQEIEGGRITYAGGVAGSSGIIYTGIGPFNIQNGSYSGYGKVNYARGGLKVNFFTNFTNAEAPNLLLADPATQQPIQLNFNTQTYDVEAGDSLAAGRHQVFTFGGNVRRNNFDITIAPTAVNRTEIGAYLQDEVLLDRFRFTIGGRVDKFGNLSDPVFSPRLAAIFMPVTGQALRVSFNRAFRAPSVVNNYLDTRIVVPTDLTRLAPFVPPPLQPLLPSAFPLVVNAVGSNLPVGMAAQQTISHQSELTEESLTAYEVSYTGTVRERTTLGAAVYLNNVDHSIKFSQLPNFLDPYTATNPPPGWNQVFGPVFGPALLAGLAPRGVFLPHTAFTYLNLGPLRQKGIELSVDHRFAKSLTAFANYSWQGRPTILSSSNPYPTQALALPPTNRFNVGFNFDGARWLGSASVNYTDKAFWSDVLTSAFYGFTDAYTMVNGSIGAKWGQGRITTLLKVNNLLNQDIQQHVFGDVLKRSGVVEVRFSLP